MGALSLDASSGVISPAMLILYDATIDCSSELREVYEWAYGDFQLDDNGRRVLDDDHLPIPINPIRFPFQHGTVTNFGSRTILSTPRWGQGDFRLDELAKSTMSRVSKGNKELYQVTGLSWRLLRQNVDIEHAAVQFTVSKWSAEHLPNQKLAVIGE